MKNELIKVLKSFTEDEMPVGQFVDELEELNKNNIWKHLSKRDSKLLSDFLFFANSLDVTLRESLHWWQRIIKQSRGEACVTTDELREQAKIIRSKLEYDEK